MNDWISVKEKLPEIIDRGERKNPCSDPILVCDGYNIEVGMRWKCGDKEYFEPNYRDDFKKIIAWMPMPKPPKN